MIRITRSQKMLVLVAKKLKNWLDIFKGKKSELWQKLNSTLSELHSNPSDFFQNCETWPPWKKETVIYHHNIENSAAHFRGLVNMIMPWLLRDDLVDWQPLPFGWTILTCFDMFCNRTQTNNWFLKLLLHCVLLAQEILKWILILTFSTFWKSEKRSVGEATCQPQKLSRPLRTTLVTDCQKKPLKLVPSSKSNHLSGGSGTKCQ